MKSIIKSLFLTVITVLMIGLVVYFAHKTSVDGYLTKGQFIKTNILVFVGCFIAYLVTTIKSYTWFKRGIDIFISNAIIGMIFLPAAYHLALISSYYAWVFPTKGTWIETHIMNDKAVFNEILWLSFIIPYGLQLLLHYIFVTLGITTAFYQRNYKSEPNM